eukprot:7506673-Alexandrium_andersonii.AAC.1
MTKAVNQELIDRHMVYMGVHWEAGRASLAPELEGFSWRDWGSLKTPDAAGRAPFGSAGPGEQEETTEQPLARPHSGRGPTA